MTTEHRKSPRRAVERIQRIGGWGNGRYHHHLACGHIEIRPRASKSPKLACASCLRAREFEGKLARSTESDDPTPTIDDYDLALGQDEVAIERSRAALARALFVPGDAIDIIAVDMGGTLEIQSALVFLSADDIARITK